MSVLVVALAVIAVAVLGGFAQHPRRSVHGRLMQRELTPAGVQAYELLALADRFEDMTVSGVPTACALRPLLREPRAALAFHALLDEPSTVAKLYGLVGVWHADPTRFAQDLAEFAKTYERGTVGTLFGCVGDRHFPVRELLYRDGAVQNAPGTPSSRVNWPDSVTLDISGGGWPLMLANAWGCD